MAQGGVDGLVDLCALLLGGVLRVALVRDGCGQGGHGDGDGGAVRADSTSRVIARDVTSVAPGSTPTGQRSTDEAQPVDSSS